MLNSACALVALLCMLLPVNWSVEGADSNQVLSSEGPPSPESSGNRQWTTGVWSPWSSWSECSRTCGRGLATQTRTCQQESEYLRIRRMRHSRIQTGNQFVHTKRCLGVFRRFQLCHNKPCEGLVDMRREQCVAYNKKPFYGTLYQWEPFVKDPSRCELQCRPVGQRFYATLAKVVDDGTPCVDPELTPNEDKICVAGQCKPVGCEGVIGSSQRWDQCGVCGGNGTTCRPVSGLFTRAILPVGYNLVAVLPRGARNIRITELARSRNFLALLAEDGTSVLNGNWSISRSGEYPGSGTVFTYRRQSEAGTQGQVVTAPGPIDRPLQIMLIYQQRNPGVQYSYTLPVRPSGSSTGDTKPSGANVQLPPKKQNSTKLPKNPKHRWKNRNKHGKRTTTTTASPAAYDASGWVAGARGRGNTSTTAYRKALPDYQRRGGVDRASMSEPATVYRQRDVLNDVAVTSAARRDIHWKMIGFSDCSQSCGGGTRLASAACFSERHKAIVGDHYCDGQPKPPNSHVSCNPEPCPGPWSVGEWSECSTSCGEGKQVRKVTCRGEAHLCTLPEAPPTARPCNLGPCFRWDATDWGQCSSTCGPGVRRRRTRCMNQATRETSDPSLCPRPRPPEESSCKTTHPCTNVTSEPQNLFYASQSEWLVTEWSREECSGHSARDSCEDNVERRYLLCALNGQLVQESACAALPRPPMTRPCSSSPSCEGEWFTGPWTKCPAHGRCGSVQSRPVVCLSRTAERDPLSDARCEGLPRPHAERRCQADCPASGQNPLVPALSRHWYSGPWTQCTLPCGPAVQTRTVLCPAAGTGQEPADQGLELCGSRRPDSQRPCPEPRPPCPPGTTTDSSGCADKIKNCQMVVQSRLCHYGYYSDICCRSCLLSLT